MASTWILPSPDLLARSDASTSAPDYSEQLLETLAELGATSNITSVHVAPQAIRYELAPCAGIRTKNYRGIEQDIMIALGVENVRIEAPTPGARTVGVEIPRKDRASVTLGDVAQFASAPLSAAVGVDMAGDPVVIDIAALPHLLIAGRSGGGKSVSIHAILCSILQHASPDELEILLIDPKMAELCDYAELPHVVKVAYDPDEAVDWLWGMVDSMEATYQALYERGCRTLDELNNQLRAEGQPIVRRRLIVCDELSDLMMRSKSKVESAMVRLGQKGRAAGFSVIVCTQSPRRECVTGMLKSNLPGRLALATSSALESRIILDQMGAENLMGQGDALYDDGVSGSLKRLQVAWCSPSDVQATCDWWIDQTYEEKDASVYALA